MDMLGANFCPRCRASNTPEAKYCDQCGAPLTTDACAQGFVKSPQFGVTYQNNAVCYVGFGKRFVAYLIDSVILAPFLIFLAYLGQLIAFFPSKTLTFLLSVSWYAFFESSSWQGTPGKKILGIKVVSEKGERLSFSMALVRTLGKTLSFIILGIGYLLIIFNSRKQALHDMLARTFVVQK